MRQSGQRVRRFYSILIVSAFLFMIFQTALSLPSGESENIVLKEPPDSNQYINRTLEIENIISQIDEPLMEKYIHRLQGFESRYSYNVPYNFRAGEFIHNQFEENGLDVHYYNFHYNTWDMRCVIGEKLGKTRPNDIYIICAHMDSISGNPYVDSPGADDNGSGSTAVLAAAEVLSDYEFNCTIRFISFSGEEQGMKGSTSYVNMVYKAGENILGVLNLDMIGYNPPDRGNFVRLCRDTDDGGTSDALITFTNQTAQKYEHIHGIKTFDASFGSSDHAPFAPTYPALMLIEMSPMNPGYHSPADSLDVMNLTYAANNTQIAVATLAELAELNSTDLAPPALHHPIPAPGSYANATPEISLELMDPGGLDIANLAVIIDGSYVAPTLSQISLGRNISYTPAVPFTDGQSVTVRIIANDTDGNYLDYNWTFTVDAVAPDAPADFTIELARQQFEKQGMVLDKGTSGDPDDVHVLAPNVMYRDGEYKMWYTGHDGSRYQICYANSSDGQTWEKQGLVLAKSPTNGDDDFRHAAFCSVIYDAGQYKMWYSGNNGTGWRILYATSPDGIIWTKQGRAIDLGAAGEPDDIITYCPGVIKTDEYEMWYTGSDGYTERILYANSSDGVTWTKHGIVVDMDLKGTYDHQRALYPNVHFNAGQYVMYYSGFDGEHYRILKANSTDGLNWNKSGLVVDVGLTGEADDTYINRASVVEMPGELKLWYSGLHTGAWKIFYANLTGDENKTDIHLAWSESGSADIKYYEVYRAGSPAGFNMSTPYRKLNRTTFLDGGLGDDNVSNYYYRLRAVDRAGNYAEVPYTLGKIARGGSAGWLLISTPFPATEKPIETVLATVDWEMAEYYNASRYAKLIEVAGETVFGPAVGGETGPFDLAHTNIRDLTLYSDQDGWLAPGIDYAIDMATGQIDIAVGLSEMQAGESLIAYYNYTQPAGYWQSNDLSRLPQFNDLEKLDNTMAVWVKLPEADVFASVGKVADVSMELMAGWNFVSYPLHEEIEVQNALAGVPYDKVEANNQTQPYGLEPLADTDIMHPGQGYWLHLTAAYTWDITNT